MLPDVLIILSLLLLAWACRTYNNRYIAKLGWVAILVASYFSGYFVSGNEPLWGIMGVALWFVFPWVEILGRVSKLRFPIISEVKHRFPPSRDIFPDLDEISSEVEASGFEQTDDAGWKWEDTDNFVRIFYHQAKRLQATINIAQQGDFVFSHACLTTRTEDGHAYMTTNYPFSLTMKLGPKQIMNRCNDAEVFEDMLQSHESFLAKQQIADIQRLAQDPDALHEMIQRDLSQQVAHNLLAGVIVRADEQHFRYSWRGYFFLWLQVIKDMIRV